MRTSTRKSYTHAERPEQKRFVAWFKHKYPSIVIAHFANGGKRDAREGKHFKDMGVLAGMPDLFIGQAMGEYHGLFIEMKPVTATKCAVTYAQKDVGNMLRRAGYRVVVCYGSTEAEQITEEYLKKSVDTVWQK